tara:strand:- start:1276 stop:1452 length:177 start_codon:yes stop_codon:yes gene_type:complete
MSKEMTLKEKDAIATMQVAQVCAVYGEDAKWYRQTMPNKDGTLEEYIIIHYPRPGSAN